ncbi:hypothetical protein AVEN_42489-1 [Araneus ventricosus]|uniref:Uncharacterized protein n=1 Tax=Araneus ventricosus TaxID=182803 RepID=A0A4Y2TSV5_ARAVE|nr:hypothetical protein AVEN_42489-1 [Araneus ventricosus]
MRYTCDVASGALFQTHPAFPGRRRQQQKSWQLGPRRSPLDFVDECFQMSPQQMPRQERSGERAGQSVVPPRPIHRPGNLASGAPHIK